MIAKLDKRLAANERKFDIGFKPRERIAGLLSASEAPSTAPAWAVHDGSNPGEIHCTYLMHLAKYPSALIHVRQIMVYFAIRSCNTSDKRQPKFFKAKEFTL
jgi:hypothetical protein